MIDRIFLEGNAKPLIKNLIIHHSAGGYCKNKKEDSVRNSLSNVGFNRGYKKYGYDQETGKQFSWRCSKCNYYSFKGCDTCSKCGNLKTWEPLEITGYHELQNEKTREPTFAMYHFVVYEYTADNNEYGYKFVNLILKPLYFDSGSTKSAKTNQVSIALCFLGNYQNHKIKPEALKCAADGLKWVKDYTKGKLNILGHRDVQEGTVCPGRIHEQIPELKKLMGVIPC